MALHVCHEVFHEGSLDASLHRLRVDERWLEHRVGILARCCLLCAVAVGHHHHHRFALALSYQVVEYLRGAAQLAPCVLVAASPVEQVERGVGRGGLCVVAWRQVDGCASLGHAESGRGVPLLEQRAVGDVAHDVVLGAFAVDDEVVLVGSDVAQHIYVGRIVHPQSVDNEAIGVQFRGQRFALHAPHALVVFRHGGSFAVGEAAFHLHAVGLRCKDAQRHAVVGIDLRRSDVAGVQVDGLLCIACNAQQARKHGHW